MIADLPLLVVINARVRQNRIGRAVSRTEEIAMAENQDIGDGTVSIIDRNRRNDVVNGVGSSNSKPITGGSMCKGVAGNHWID